MKLRFLLMPGLLLAAVQLMASPDAPVRQAPRLLRAVEHGVGRLVPDVALTDLNGKSVRLSDFKAKRALVIALTSPSCPLSQKFAPTLAKLEDEWRARGVAFMFVNPVAADAALDCKAAAKAHGFDGPVIRDLNGALARTLGALTTTDAFVLDAARTLVYRGAVDDQYGLGYSQDAPRHRYLTDALTATLASKSPPTAATWAPGCELDLKAAKPVASPTKATYHGRIARLVQSQCVECHRAGGVAPFSLETRDDLVARAGAIRRVIEQGTMPPWFAAPPQAGEPSPWVNDRSLVAADKAELLAWLGSDRATGEAREAPLPRKWPTEWALGTPDAVLQIPKPLAVKATGTMPYQRAVIETNFAEAKWVQAMEVQPTAKAVVHHVLVFVMKPGAGRGRERLEEGEGFFAAYVPGNSHNIYRDGLAKPLPAGASLLFQIHYTPNGTATEDQTRIGLVFAKQPPEHVVRTIGIGQFALRIPPGADNHPEVGKLPVVFDATILSFMPHMHVRGKAFRYELIQPNGTRRTLLEVPRYDFNWQLAYRLAEPISVPRGSRLEATGWFDNSAKNPANPDPTKTVRWGPQTYEEMLLGYLEYFVNNERPRAEADE